MLSTIVAKINIYRSEFVGLVALILLALVQYLISATIFTQFTEDFYEREILLIHFPFLSKRTFVGLVLTISTFIWFTSKKPITFNELPKTIKLLLGTSVLLLIWAFSLTEYNYYFESWFLVDRILLVVFGLYCFINPYAFLPFVIQAVILAKQFAFPDCFSYTFADKQIIFDILIISWVFIILTKLLSGLKWHYLVIMILAVISNWYLRAGIGKLGLDWIGVNELYYLYAASYDYGWLYFLTDHQAISVGQFLKYNNDLIQATTLVVELIGPILLILNRITGLIALLSFIAFHLLVFFSSGIFFWKWITLELVLIFIYWKNPNEIQQLFTFKYLIIYLVVLFCGRHLFTSTSLSWLDSGYMHTYKFALKDVAGTTSPLDASFFSPYDVIFSQNRFHAMFNEPKLSSTYGSTKNPDLVSLASGWEGSREDFRNLESLRSSARNFYSESETTKIRHFLMKFTRNKLEKDYRLINYIDPPLHIWQGPNQQNFDFEQATELLLVAQDKILFPNLDSEILKSDTLVITLKH